MERIRTDFLVLGAGVAGLQAALELCAHGEVLVLTKSKISESSSEYAQGGVAVALSDEDSLDLHYEDTIRAGAGLCYPEAVRVLVDEGPARIQELIQRGARFDRADSRYMFTREGAHSASRILHSGDATGREVMRALREAAAVEPRIRAVPHAFVRDLWMHEGRCIGAVFASMEGVPYAVEARAVLAATGGAGRVFLETTNPPVATGDGTAMAWRAGALLADMEFFQFHPTALYLTGAPRFLLTEALRGEGGRLVNVRGEPFMKKYHELGDLAPRDVVSRSILLEARLTHHPCVYMELSHLGEAHLKNRFPAIHQTCAAYGLDIAKERVPVLPAAHYFMGGIWTDTHGRSSLPGLYAAGEASCNGVHGANRLASNSLLEGLVYGRRAALAMRDCSAVSDSVSPPAAASKEHYIQPETKRDILSLAWQKVGVFRSAKTLGRAMEHLDRLLPTIQGAYIESWAAEVQNIALNVWLMARSALAREESRGTHYREDHPERNPAMDGRHSFISRDRELCHETMDWPQSIYRPS